MKAAPIVSNPQYGGLGKLLDQMSVKQQRVLIYLGRLYLERQVAPGAEVDGEIEGLERAIRNGDIPPLPRTQ